MNTHDYGTCGYPLSSGKPCPAKARLTPQGLRCGKHSPEGIRRAQEAVQARREAKEREREVRHQKAEGAAEIVNRARRWAKLSDQFNTECLLQVIAKYERMTERDG